MRTLILSGLVAVFHATGLSAATYHIDPAHGDDRHTGLSKDKAWKTFHPLERITLAPGDRIEIRPGRFDHSLSVSASGTAEKPIGIHFAAGRYDIDPAHAHRETYAISNTNDDPDGRKAVGLHFQRAKHVAITGEGAVLVARGKMMHVCLDACEDITLEGLAFDYHRPTVSEFTVASTTEDSAEIVVHKDSAYSIANAALTWQGEGWTETGGLGQELDPGSGRVKRMKDPLAGLRLEETKPFHLRATGKHRLKSGFIYQIRNPFRDYCGVFTRNSRDITWQNIHFRFIHGMGMVNQFSENLTFDHVRIAPDPQSGRTTAAWADCIQASGCRGRFLVNRCLFSGAHDDAINVHGTYLRVMEPQADRREVKVRFAHRQTFGFPAFHAGDEVEFVRWDSLETYGSNRVVSAVLQDPHTMLLALETPLPDTVREKDVMENVTWTPEVEIRGCVVRHIPTRAFLCATRRKVLIEDNDFHATQMPGILVSSDAGSWFESGCVRDMLIRNNRFHDCGEPAIHIDPRNSAPHAAFHRNIRIENNTFHLRDKCAIGARSTTGLRITGNTIHASKPLGVKDWLHTDGCAEIVVEGNASRP